MLIKSITKQDTNIYIGIGIILIVLHIFFYWMPPFTAGENEFDFSPVRIQDFLTGFSWYPSEFINLLFSYLGHYCVHIFIFISGLGLALSMQKKHKNWGSFILGRIKKLYPLLIVGLLFFFFGEIIVAKRFLTIPEWREFLYKFLFIHTLLPGSGLSIIGPWWFFGLIFQLYILFPLLFKIIKKYQLKGFIIICLFSYACMYINQYIYNILDDISIMQNLPEFTLVILIAFKFNKRINIIWIILASAVFILGNFFEYFFPLTFLCITLIIFWALNRSVPFIIERMKNTTKFLSFYGAISMALFVVHASYRQSFIAISGSTFWNKLLGALLFLMAITAISILARDLYKWIIEKINNFELKTVFSINKIL